MCGLTPTKAARAAYLLIVYVFGSIALEVADVQQPGPLPPESGSLVALGSSGEQGHSTATWWLDP